MTKKIIHFQIPMGKNEKLMDNFLIRAETVGKFMKLIKDAFAEAGLNDEYVLIVSPFIPSISEGTEFVNFTIDEKNLDKFFELCNVMKGSDGKLEVLKIN